MYRKCLQNKRWQGAILDLNFLLFLSQGAEENLWPSQPCHFWLLHHDKMKHLYYQVPTTAHQKKPWFWTQRLCLGLKGNEFSFIGEDHFEDYKKLKLGNFDPFQIHVLPGRQERVRSSGSKLGCGRQERFILPSSLLESCSWKGCWILESTAQLSTAACTIRITSTKATKERLIHHTLKIY